MMTVQLGSLTLPGTLVGDFGFWFETITDWYSVSDSKANPLERPQAHGAFGAGFDWRERKVLSIEGHYWGASYASTLAAVNQLTALGSGSLVTLTVTDDLGPTSREVSIRFITIPDLYGMSNFDFSIDLIATDPRRYGATVSTSTGVPVAGGGLIWPITWPITWGGGGVDGRVTLLNAGTAEAAPLLEVTGGLGSGFTIDEVGSGRQVRFERFIPVGSTVFLNPRTGRAYIDAPGNDVSGFLTRSDWPFVPAQSSDVLQFNPLGVVTGTPTLTARLAPAYW